MAAATPRTPMRSTVSGDVVLTQTQNVDDGDGNVIETITSDRFSTDSTSATGALGTRDNGIEARTYYVGYYYDDADRPIATVNVGTHVGSVWEQALNQRQRIAAAYKLKIPNRSFRSGC